MVSYYIPYIRGVFEPAFYLEGSYPCFCEFFDPVMQVEVLE